MRGIMTMNISKIKLTGLGAVSAIAMMVASGASAQQVFVTDVIIQGSLCVGFDCVNGESFGFDTIRIKENNTRLHFQDTSTSASFPSNDWRIVANDTSNGGANYLAFEDATAGRQPFRVEAGAPANTLYVESDGDVGIKTSNPVVDLHVVEGNTPTLRLEQDGSDGFTPQTWDVAGNEAGFFIRDVTNGSQLAFRIEPGADASSIHIDNVNNVGLGTSNPQADLDIHNSGADVLLQLSNTSGSSINNWVIKNNMAAGRLTFGAQGGTTPFKIDNDAANNLLRLGPIVPDRIDVAGSMLLTGTITTSGSCSVGCDRVFAPDYELASIQEHAVAMWENGYLPNVGPTAENGQYDLSNKMLRMLNELEHAHIYIAEMNDRIVMLEEKLALQE